MVHLESVAAVGSGVCHFEQNLNNTEVSVEFQIAKTSWFIRGYVYMVDGRTYRYGPIIERCFLSCIAMARRGQGSLEETCILLGDLD